MQQDFDRVDVKHQKSKSHANAHKQSKAPRMNLFLIGEQTPRQREFSIFWGMPGDRFEACGRRRVSSAAADHESDDLSHHKWSYIF